MKVAAKSTETWSNRAADQFDEDATGGGTDERHVAHASGQWFRVQIRVRLQGKVQNLQEGCVVLQILWCARNIVVHRACLHEMPSQRQQVSDLFNLGLHAYQTGCQDEGEISSCLQKLCGIGHVKICVGVCLKCIMDCACEHLLELWICVDAFCKCSGQRLPRV